MEALLRLGYTGWMFQTFPGDRQYQYVGGIPKYRDASQNLGTLALSCSKSLWLFYLFCQLFLKPTKSDKFLFKEIFSLIKESNQFKAPKFIIILYVAK